MFWAIGETQLKLYGTPVLLSGLPSLILADNKLAAVHHQHKVNLQRLQRLCLATLECVVMFLGGSIPATGILHPRILGLFGMIARLGPENILHIIHPLVCHHQIYH